MLSIDIFNHSDKIMNMNVTDFDYQLPDELIARFPTAERTASRLLCFDNNMNKIQHRRFCDIVDLLNPNDLLIFTIGILFLFNS